MGVLITKSLTVWGSMSKLPFLETLRYEVCTQNHNYDSKYRNHRSCMFRHFGRMTIDVVRPSGIWQKHELLCVHVRNITGPTLG